MYLACGHMYTVGICMCVIEYLVHVLGLWSHVHCRHMYVCD